MKRLIFACAGLALAALTGGQGRAQDAGAPMSDAPMSGSPAPGHWGGVRQACAADMANLCPGADHRAARQCMNDKFDQLSDGCKAAVTAMRARRSEGGDGAAPQSSPPAGPAS